LVQSPSDASVDEIPTGDLETAKAYAKRVQAIVKKYMVNELIKKGAFSAFLLFMFIMLRCIIFKAFGFIA
jgi:hypothetical protein